MKILINSCFGGFSISEKAILRYAELKGMTVYPEKDKYGNTVYWTVPPEQQPVQPKGDWMSVPLEERQAYNELYCNSTLSERNYERNDPLLIQVVEELGAEAHGG